MIVQTLHSALTIPFLSIKQIQISIFLQWVIVRVDKECASVHLNKDIVPHSLRFKFEVTPSKVTKDIPEFKALTERASAALSSFQT